MPLKALLSHYRYYPWQALFLLCGLVAGVALWSAVQIINGHARASYASADSLLGTRVTWLIRRPDGGELSFEQYVALRRAGFRNLIPVVETSLITEEGQLVGVIGTDLLALGVPGQGEAWSGEQLSSSGWLDFITPPYRTWASRELAERLGLKEGDRLHLGKGRYLPELKIMDASGAGVRLLLDLGAAQALPGVSGLDYIAAASMEEKQVLLLRERLPEPLILEASQRSLDLSQLTRSLHIHLSALSLLCFAVGLFIVANAVRFSIRYRQPTLLAMGLMGVGPAQLAAWLVLETLIIGMLASCLGLAAGYFLAWLLLPEFATALQGLYEVPVSLELLIRPETLLTAFGLTWCGLLLALVPPLASQTRRSLAEIRVAPLVWQDDQQVHRYLALVAGFSAVLAMLLWQQITGVLMGFLVLVFCLLAVVCILPELLSVLLSLARYAIGEGSGRKLILRWIVLDGWAQLPLLRTTMMALLLAMTANIGVEVLIDSFRSAFTNWLDKRLSADIYVQSDNADPSALARTGMEEGWLLALHERSLLEFRWRGRQVQVRGVDPSAPDISELPLAEPADVSAGRLLTNASPGSVPALANEQLRYLAGIELGETIELPTPGGEVAVQVVGFFHDYGSASFQFYLTLDAVQRFWPDTRTDGFAIWLNDNRQEMAAEDPARVEAVLRASGFDRWIWQSEIKILSQKIFERTFAITAAMNGLTLLVAVVAMVSSLVAMVQARSAELALWRSLGVPTGLQLAVLVFSMGGFLLVTWLLALPTGYLVAWLLVNKLNVVSFGWTLPLEWSFDPALRLFLLSCLLLGCVLLLAAMRPQAATGLSELSARGATL